MLGRGGIEKLMQLARGRSSQAVVESLFDGVQRFTQRSTFQDDVTVVALVRE